MRYRNVPVDALFVLIALSVGIDLDLYGILVLRLARCLGSDYAWIVSR